MTSVLGQKVSLVFDSVSLSGPWAEEGLLWSWAFESGVENFSLHHPEKLLSNRCVELQTQLACNLVNKELLEYPFLLLDLEKQLLEVQENLIISGCKKKSVDLKLEHARIKK